MTELLLSPTVKFWVQEIELYERTFEKWIKRGKKIYKRYKDVRTPREDAVTRMNILWSNVQTRIPALYARDPKPEVERRFKDRDPIGRAVAEVLERSLDYTIQHCNPFGRTIRQAVLDYELSGRGTTWLRYVPHFHRVVLAEAEASGSPGPASAQSGNEPVDQETNLEVKEEGEELTNEADDEVGEERLKYEETILDYVYWEDFGHTWARTWDEVRAVWRRIYLTREEGLERFGKAFLTVPLDWSPKNLNDAKIGNEQKKAVIYEIWDKQEHQVIWISKVHPDTLDEKDDPLGLENFFPLPPPLFANLGNDELIPVPNFTYYQDQANEVDELSTRIAAIGKALKVAGIYDSSAPGIDRLLSEGVENQLIPIEGWSALMQKGGLKGAMEFIPLKDIAEALASLREQRQMMIDDIHEITGLSDIIRGNSEPNETATAQQIKGQFASLRISDAQTEIQRYCRDIMRIMAQLIADYDIETLKQISGVKLLTNAEKQQISALLQNMQQVQPGVPGGNSGPANPGSPMPMQGMQQMGGAPGQQGGMSGPQPGAQPTSNPIDPQKIALLKEPSWEDVEALLKNPVLREFRIDVETDSTIRIDEEADRAARMEFMDAVAKMITEAANVPHPLIPAAGELIMFGIRGFKVARNLEHAFEEAIDQLKDAPPPPDPEMAKIQAQIQGDQAVAQIKAQSEQQIAAHKAQYDAALEQSKQQVQAQGDQLRNRMELERAAGEAQLKAQHETELEALKQQHEQAMEAAKIEKDKQIAAAKNATDLQIAQMKMQHEAEQKAADRQHEAAITSLNQAHEQKMAEHQSKHEAGMEKLKGENSERLEDKKGATQEKLAKLKPKAEAEAANEKEAEHPHVKAIEKLTEALKEARKPRKVKRDESGKIVEIH